MLQGNRAKSGEIGRNRANGVFNEAEIRPWGRSMLSMEVQEGFVQKLLALQVSSQFHVALPVARLSS